MHESRRVLRRAPPGGVGQGREIPRSGARPGLSPLALGGRRRGDSL